MINRRKLTRRAVLAGSITGVVSATFSSVVIAKAKTSPKNENALIREPAGAKKGDVDRSQSVSSHTKEGKKEPLATRYNTAVVKRNEKHEERIKKATGDATPISDKAASLTTGALYAASKANWSGKASVGAETAKMYEHYGKVVGYAGVVVKGANMFFHPSEDNAGELTSEALQLGLESLLSASSKGFNQGFSMEGNLRISPRAMNIAVGVFAAALVAEKVVDLYKPLIKERVIPAVREVYEKARQDPAGTWKEVQQELTMRALVWAATPHFLMPKK